MTCWAKVEVEAERQKIGVIRNELQNHLNFNTLERLTSFVQLAKDESMLPQERLALAVSGWLVGSDQALVNLPWLSRCFRFAVWCASI